MEQTKTQLKEEFEKWLHSDDYDYYVSINNQGKISDWWLSKIDTLLKQHTEEMVERIKKAWDYPCSCGIKTQKVCDHNYNSMFAVVALIKDNIKE